jgi:hypothetical protein
MQRKRVERDSGNYSRSHVQTTADVCSITRDVLTAVAGVVLIVGIPFVMAVLKQWGWW